MRTSRGVDKAVANFKPDLVPIRLAVGLRHSRPQQRACLRALRRLYVILTGARLALITVRPLRRDGGRDQFGTLTA